MTSSSGTVEAGSEATDAVVAQNALALDGPFFSDLQAGSSGQSGRSYVDLDQRHDLDDANDSATPTPTAHRGGKSLSTLAVHPRFSRALSVPLASQLTHLQHPHHKLNGEPTVSETGSSELSQFRELSLELADSVQIMIQTMLHVSPPHIFDPAKEQVSACSLSIPAPSMSAMFTAMKNLNYISANMSTFLLSDGPDPNPPHVAQHNDFDIGEALQSIGDVLSGAASQAGVELVLYHADVGLKHIWVKGDENGMSYLLSHVIRQILATARRGDSIELGLIITSVPEKQSALSDGQETSAEGPLIVSPADPDCPLHCTIHVSHKYSFGKPDNTTDPRASPIFSSLLLRRLLQKVGAKFSPSIATESDSEWACEVSFTLERGATPNLTPAHTPSDIEERQGVEPTIEQLTSFVESLKGKKVTLYASSKGSFAHHLTSYLTAWGLDVSHGDADGADSESSTPPLKALGPQPEPPSLIFIDDDVTVLKQRLNALRMEHAPQFSLRKRPSLAPHRNVSSTHIARPKQYNSIVVVHFASLSNFKIIRDVIQSVLSTYMGSLISVPEVMIIPKPAGPRRLLTALHTALTKPVVDPFFSPIATSPGSPSMVSGGSFMSAQSNSSNTSSPKSPLPHRPSGSRTDSDRSTRSNKDELSTHPPSPLGMPENVEYFTQTLGTSPSSGYVIQSPDGKTAGILFHPNSKSGPPRLPSGTMDKNHNSPNLPSRTPSQNNAPITFSSLHEASQTSRASPLPPAATAGVRSPPIEPDKSPVARLKNSPIITPTNEVKPIPPLLRSMGRRTTSGSSTKTQNTSPGKKTKGPDENKIVPPVSVLIVDDNPINQTILSTFMKKKRIKYDVASNGAEAVQKWRTGEFHLILMDIQMPIMDGIDATKEIRRLERSFASEGYISDQLGSPLGTPTGSSASEPRPSPHRTSVIIVALTASSLQSDRVAALAAGCNDFLTKPVHLPWLNNKIIEWGSIKALQMWAGPGPELVETQTAQAQTVAERLHVPLRKTPSLNQQSVHTAYSPAAPSSAASVGSSHWMNGQPSAGVPSSASTNADRPSEAGSEPH